MIEKIPFPKPKLHLFVCTNDRTIVPGNAKSSCGPRMTAEKFKELKRWILEQGLAGSVYCTQAKCLGFCNSDASVACIYPKGIFVKYQNIEELKELINEELS